MAADTITDLRPTRVLDFANARPIEPCPICDSRLLVIHDGRDEHGPGHWHVFCRECGCAGFEHVNRQMAVLCWDSGAAAIREQDEIARTIGWTWPLPPSAQSPFHPMEFGVPL